MGNHEFCEECSESNFHYGRPCDPDRKAKYQARLQRDRQADAAAIEVVKRLKKLGYQAEIHLSSGDVLIKKHSLVK